MLIGAPRRRTRASTSGWSTTVPDAVPGPRLARRPVRACADSLASRRPQVLQRPAPRVDGEHGGAAGRVRDGADRAGADDDALEQVEGGAEGVGDGGLDRI